MMKGGSKNITFNFDKDQGGEVIDNVKNITEGTTKFLEKIVSQLVDDRKYPAGTTQTIELFFQINYGKEIYDVKVLDYPGEQAKETLGKKNEDDEMIAPTFEEQVDSFFSHKETADAFVFLVNPFYFIEGNVKYGEWTAYFQRIIEALKIIRKKNKGKFKKCPVAFVLTQADRFAKYIDSAEDFVNKEMAQVSKEAERIGQMKILHVSATGKTTEEENKKNIPPAPINPENVDDPFHFIFRTFKKIKNRKRQFKVWMTIFTVGFIALAILGWDFGEYFYTERAMDRDIPWIVQTKSANSIIEVAKKRHEILEKIIDFHSWKRFCVSKSFIRQKQAQYWKEAGKRIETAYPNAFIIQYKYWNEMNQKLPGIISSNKLIEARTKATKLKKQYFDFCENSIFDSNKDVSKEKNRIFRNIKEFSSEDFDIKNKINVILENYDNLFDIYHEYTRKKYKTFDGQENVLNNLKPSKDINNILTPVFIFKDFITKENEKITKTQNQLEIDVLKLKNLINKPGDNIKEIEESSRKIVNCGYPENEMNFIFAKDTHKNIVKKMRGADYLFDAIEKNERNKNHSETVKLCAAFKVSFPDNPNCNIINEKLKIAEKATRKETDEYVQLYQELKKGNITKNCTNWINKINTFLNREYVDNEHKILLKEYSAKIIKNKNDQDELYKKAINFDNSEPENLTQRLEKWNVLSDNWSNGKYIDETNKKIEQISDKLKSEKTDYTKLSQELKKGNLTKDCTNWINKINAFLNREYVDGEHEIVIKKYRIKITKNKNDQEIQKNKAESYDNSEPGKYLERLDKWREIRDKWANGEYIDEANNKIKEITDEWQVNQVGNIEKVYNNAEYAESISKVNTFIKDWENNPLTPKERLQKVKKILINAKSGLESSYWEKAEKAFKTALNCQEKVEIIKNYKEKCEDYDLIISAIANKKLTEFREKAAEEQWSKKTTEINLNSDIDAQSKNITIILSYIFSPDSLYRFANPTLKETCKKMLDSCRDKYIYEFKEKANESRSNFKFEHINSVCDWILDDINEKIASQYRMDKKRIEIIKTLIDNYQNWYKKWNELEPNENCKIIITKLEDKCGWWEPKIGFKLDDNDVHILEGTEEIWEGEMEYDLNSPELCIELWVKYNITSEIRGKIYIKKSLENKSPTENFNQFPGEKIFYVWPYGFSTDKTTGTVKFRQDDDDTGQCQIVFRIEPSIEKPPEF